MASPHSLVRLAAAQDITVKALLIKALKAEHGSIKGAARRLCVSPRNIYYHMKKQKITLGKSYKVMSEKVKS